MFDGIRCMWMRGGTSFSKYAFLKDYVMIEFGTLCR